MYTLVPENFVNKKQEEIGENIDNLKVLIMIFDIGLIMFIG